MAITKATASSIAPAAKGDLVVGSATNDAAVLTVGANGTTLVADSAETTGLKWATPAAGGMTLLSTTTLSGTSTTISSIDQTYTDLKVILNNATSTGGTGFYLIQMNGSASNSNTAYTDINSATRSMNSNGQFYDTGTVNCTLASVYIQNYTSTTLPKFGLLLGGSNTGYAYSTGGYCYNAATAITSVKISHSNGNTMTGGTILIYGVK